MNHSVSDLVTRVRNGYLAKKVVISSPISKLRESILQILKDEGYISNFSKFIEEGKKIGRFDIQLKYHNSLPVMSEVSVISKPGKRVYCGAEDIPLVKNGLGVVVISTSKGLLPDHEARAQKLGGEVLFKIF